MFLTDLADVVRTSGLHVIEVDGWQTRTEAHYPSGMGSPRGVVCHHTGSVGAAGDYPTLNTIIHGRVDLPGPLAQLGLGRSGTVYVIAAGLCYHAGDGSWPGLRGNWDCIGIEAESEGYGRDWTPEQRDAYPRLCAALCDGYAIDAALVIAHREWAPQRKVDPTGIDMTQLRATVSDLLAGHSGEGGDHDPLDPPEEDDMTPDQAKQLATVAAAVAKMTGAATGDTVLSVFLAPGEAKTLHVNPRNTTTHTGAMFVSTAWGNNEPATETVPMSGKQFVNPDDPQHGTIGLWGDTGDTWDLDVLPRGAGTGKSAQLREGVRTIWIANNYPVSDDPAVMAAHTVHVVVDATPAF